MVIRRKKADKPPAFAGLHPDSEEALRHRGRDHLIKTPPIILFCFMAS
jgi:hypothetical protein